MRKRTEKDKANMDLEKVREFYFFEGIVYQDPLTMPASNYNTIKPKGRQIPGQPHGNLKVPGYGVN